jgi:hypothetical protein
VARLCRMPVRARWLWAKKVTKEPSTLVLLAEIKGKGCPELEGEEDLITSAVFGHLRSVPRGIFWHMLLSKAKNVADPPISLAQELKEKGVDFSQFPKLQVLFWEACGAYGEPDIVLRFTSADGLSIVIVVEVKLNSAKSSSGETDDQLERYLRLLDDDGFHLEWKMASACRFVVYLTGYSRVMRLPKALVARSNRMHPGESLAWSETTSSMPQTRIKGTCCSPRWRSFCGGED